MTATKPARRTLAALLSLTLFAAAPIAAASEPSEGVTSRGDASATIAPADLTDDMRAAILRAQGVTQIWGPKTLRRQPIKLFDQAFRDASTARNAEQIAKLTQAFIDLGPGVDPEEAARAARAVYTYVDQLVVEYQIEDGPLIHNSKVNMGVKPRGLCWHWAHDVDMRLQMERFETLKIFRAIANYNNIRLEHSTTLLGVPGGRMEDAIVLDPWRKAGDLVWKVAREDTRYNWTPRDEVFAFKRKMEENSARREDRAETVRADR